MNILSAVFTSVCSMYVQCYGNSFNLKVENSEWNINTFMSKATRNYLLETIQFGDKCPDMESHCVTAREDIRTKLHHLSHSSHTDQTMK